MTWHKSENQAPETSFAHTLASLQAHARSLSEGEQLLAAGDIVEGFETLDEVDCFSDMIMQINTNFWYDYKPFNPENYRLGPRGHRDYRGWKTGTKHADEAIKPKNYIGKFKNITAILLDDIIRPVWELDSEPRTSTYGLFADMYSGGRGNIGKIAKLIEVQSNIPSKMTFRNSAVKYSNLPADNAKAAAEHLRTESAITVNQVILNGLSRIYLAGLPGLGKNNR